MNNQNLEIDTQYKGYVKRVYAVQGDSGRSLECSLLDLALQEGYTATIYAVKPSGARIFNSCELGETVKVELTEQILAETGSIPCQIEIKDSNDARVTAFVFTLEVAENISDLEYIVSSDEFEVLNTALSNVEIALEALDSNWSEATNKLNAMLDDSKNTLTESLEDLQSELAEMAKIYKEIYNQATVNFLEITDAEIEAMFEDSEELTEEE